MKRKIQNTLLAIAIVFGLSGVLVAVQPAAVYALDANQQAVCDAIGTGSSCEKGTGGANKLNGVIDTIINILSVLVGIIAVIMIIVAGFKYVTSAGDSSKVSSAKSTLIYALVGIVIVALSQTIVKFVLDRVT